MSEAKEDKAEGEAGEAKPKSKKKLFIILGVVLLLAGAGVPMFLMGGEEKKEGEEVEEVEEVKHYETAKLDTFIVNLSENSTFLKTTILVEYDRGLIDAAGGPGGGEAAGGGHGGGGGEPAAGASLHPIFEKRKAMVHDAVIGVLSSKRSAEVLTAEGKEELKAELVEAINEALGLDESPVIAVYFTEFIIQ